MFSSEIRGQRAWAMDWPREEWKQTMVKDRFNLHNRFLTNTKCHSSRPGGMSLGGCQGACLEGCDHDQRLTSHEEGGGEGRKEGARQSGQDIRRGGACLLCAVAVEGDRNGATKEGQLCGSKVQDGRPPSHFPLFVHSFSKSFACQRTLSAIKKTVFQNTALSLSNCEDHVLTKSGVVEVSSCGKFVLDVGLPSDSLVHWDPDLLLLWTVLLLLVWWIALCWILLLILYHCSSSRG
jgi:hypothetical protein